MEEWKLEMLLRIQHTTDVGTNQRRCRRHITTRAVTAQRENPYNLETDDAEDSIYLPEVGRFGGATYTV